MPRVHRVSKVHLAGQASLVLAVRTANRDKGVHSEKREKGGVQGLGARALEDHLVLLAYQVKDGQAARAQLVGLVTREHREGQVIQEPREQLAHRGTVTRIRVWDTTPEFNGTMGTITEELFLAIFLSSSSKLSPSLIKKSTHNLKVAMFPRKEHTFRSFTFSSSF